MLTRRHSPLQLQPQAQEQSQSLNAQGSVCKRWFGGVVCVLLAVPLVLITLVVLLRLNALPPLLWQVVMAVVPLRMAMYDSERFQPQDVFCGSTPPASTSDCTYFDAAVLAWSVVSVATTPSAVPPLPSAATAAAERLLIIAPARPVAEPPRPPAGPHDDDGLQSSDEVLRRSGFDEYQAWSRARYRARTRQAYYHRVMRHAEHPWDAATGTGVDPGDRRRSGPLQSRTHKTAAFKAARLSPPSGYGDAWEPEDDSERLRPYCRRSDDVSSYVASVPIANGLSVHLLALNGNGQQPHSSQPAPLSLPLDVPLSDATSGAAASAAKEWMVHDEVLVHAIIPAAEPGSVWVHLSFDSRHTAWCGVSRLLRVAYSASAPAQQPLVVVDWFDVPQRLSARSQNVIAVWDPQTLLVLLDDDSSSTNVNSSDSSGTGSPGGGGSGLALLDVATRTFRSALHVPLPSVSGSGGYSQRSSDRGEVSVTPADMIARPDRLQSILLSPSALLNACHGGSGAVSPSRLLFAMAIRSSALSDGKAEEVARYHLWDKRWLLSAEELERARVRAIADAHSEHQRSSRSLVLRALQLQSHQPTDGAGAGVTAALNSGAAAGLHTSTSASPVPDHAVLSSDGQWVVVTAGHGSDDDDPLSASVFDSCAFSDAVAAAAAVDTASSPAGAEQAAQAQAQRANQRFSFLTSHPTRGVASAIAIGSRPPFPPPQPRRRDEPYDDSRQFRMADGTGTPQRNAVDGGIPLRVYTAGLQATPWPGSERDRRRSSSGSASSGDDTTPSLAYVVTAYDAHTTSDMLNPYSFQLVLSRKQLHAAGIVPDAVGDGKAPGWERPRLGVLSGREAAVVYLVVPGMRGAWIVRRDAL